MSTLYNYIANVQYVDPTDKATGAVITLLGGEGSAAFQAAMDPWGNVCIPSLNYDPDYDPKDPHKWVEIPGNNKLTNYCNLVGDRVDGVSLTMTGNTTFQSSSSYQTFDVSLSGLNSLFNLSGKYSYLSQCTPWFCLNSSNTWIEGDTKRTPRVSRNDPQAGIWFSQHTGYDLLFYFERKRMFGSSTEVPCRTFFLDVVLGNDDDAQHPGAGLCLTEQ
jgi:hypothetical protein